MGIYQDIQTQFQKPNNVLVKLILINVMVWVVDWLLKVPSIIFDLSLFSQVFEQQMLPGTWGELLWKPWTMITYMFTHNTNSIIPFHLLFNMLGLYWFGFIVQDLINNQRVLSLYILGGLFAAVCYIVFASYISPSVGLIGASGSVYAIIVAAATLSPTYEVQLLFFGRVKIIYIAATYIFLSFIGTVGSNAGGEVAHLGGALFGYLYIKLLKTGVDLGAWLQFSKVFSTSSFKITKNNAHTLASKEGINTAEVDRILDKISKSGYESLTQKEKQTLFEASKK
jgi:membrane associated rhomboid family serine protease